MWSDYDATPLTGIQTSTILEYKRATHALVVAEGFEIHLYKQPNVFHRWMQKIFFGFTYKELN